VTSIKGVEFILRASKTCESITLVLHIIHLAPSDLRIPPSPSPSHGGSTTSEKQRIASHHTIKSATAHHILSLGILGLLCAEGEKTSPYRVIPPSKTRNSRSRPKPFLSNQGLRARRSREYRKGRESRSFSYTRRGKTTYTSRSSLDQLARTPT
jgi:hypothetical protein